MSSTSLDSYNYALDALLTFPRTKPDGFLTEERKAADPDQGFSTFFSETGTIGQPSRYFVSIVLNHDRPGKICASHHLLRPGAKRDR